MQTTAKYRFKFYDLIVLKSTQFSTKPGKIGKILIKDIKYEFTNPQF
jgi:hypothetical protein